MNNQPNSQNGFSLIEALVVMIVVAIGLLALAAFHGDLLSGSGLSKARGEALMLARDKLEELTNNVRKDQYVATLVNTGVSVFSTPPETINGKNAVFQRDWQIADFDQSTSDDFKEVVVRVRWTDPKAGSQNVLANSYLAFNDPSKYGTLDSPSGTPGNRGLNPKRSGIKGPQPGAPSNQSGEWLALTDIPTNTFKWGLNSLGNVVLLDSSGNVLYTFFGQSLQYVSGRVYYDETDFTDIHGNAEIVMFASEPAYCAGFPIGADTCPASGHKTTSCGIVGSYICFFSGDCQNGDTGDLGALDCSHTNPNGSSDFNDVAGLDGGWYGKVGIAGIAALNPLKTICQADIDDDNQTKSPAREYVSVRDLGSGAAKYEGINQSFEYQNFVVARLTDPLNDCSALVNDFSYTPPDVGLPPSKVHRYLTSAALNQVQQLNNYWQHALNIVAKAGNWSTSRMIRNDSRPVPDNSGYASGSASTWPDDECVAWPAGTGFSCSLPDGWTGTITLNVVNGATSPTASCSTTITIGAAPTTQSTKLNNVTLCTP